MIRTTNIRYGQVNLESVKYVTEEVYQQWTRRQIPQRGDVLLTREAPMGEAGMLLTDEKVFLGQRIVSYRANPQKLDNYFLLYALQSKDLQAQIRDRASGSTVQHMRVPDTKTLQIPLPALSEQKRIVAILDEVFAGIDEAIANTEKNLTNARELFENYLDTLFIRRQKDWKSGKLSDFCERVEYGSSAKSKPEGKIPVLRMGNIQNGAIDWENLVYTSDQEEIDRYLLKQNDVLFNRTNSDVHVGKTAIYKGKQPAIFAGYLIRIHRKPELNADFLNYYLNSGIARRYGQTVMSRSVNQANINGTKLKGYPISVPSLSVQKEIVKKAHILSTETQRLETIYQQKLTALNDLKQSILQKAFTGELTADTASQAEKAKEAIAA